MKRVFIVHQWGSSPAGDWYPWLKETLEAKGYYVRVPAMPHPERPTIENWVAHLANEVGTSNDNTYFIGHSVGCQTILRYLQTQETACGGAVFVAGWFTLQGLETDEENEIAEPWLTTHLGFETIKLNLPHSTAIFSDNDPYVPLSDKEIFRAKLDSDIIVEHNQGHFTESDGITSLPIILPVCTKQFGS